MQAGSVSGCTALSKLYPVIGIVGSAGAYGRWLARFFYERMGLETIGHDPVDVESLSREELIRRSDVLIFSAPIRQTEQLIREYAQLADGKEVGQLWLDVTSIKAAPVAAMLESKAEVVGLHPMSAPPKAPTLRGRTMVVCEARLDTWREWFAKLRRELDAQYFDATPEHHDQVMALVQAMVHAAHLAQAGVLREYAPALGDLSALLPFRTAAFEMDVAVLSRILSLNPAVYEDIQFVNPYSAPVIDALLRQLSALRDQLGRGDEAARGEFREHFFARNRAALGLQALADGNYGYERVSYLLADFNDPVTLGVRLTLEKPGSLRNLLHVFENHGIDIASLHSSRTPTGVVHFRFGFNSGVDVHALNEAIAEVERNGIGTRMDD